MPIKVEMRGLAKLTTALEKGSKNVKRDMGRAMSAAQRVAAAEATKAARAIYNVKRTRIAKEWRLSGFDFSSLSFTLTGVRKPISLLRYSLRKTRKGLSVQVMQSQGRTILRKSFIAKNLPWQRETNKRLPIAPLFGPSPADMLNNPLVAKAIADAFYKRMAKELTRLLDKAFP